MEQKPTIVNVSELALPKRKKPEVMCYFPECYEEGITAVNVPISNEENASADLTFCKYHSILALCKKFTAEHDVRTHDSGEQEDVFILDGPFEEIELVEAVMAAKEITQQESKK